MTDDDRANDPYFRRGVECPHCQARFFVDLDVSVCRTLKTASHETAWRDTLSEAEQHWIATATAAGVVTTFAEAVKERVGQSVPRNMESYLVVWVKTAQPRRPPRHAHEALRREWGNDYQVWQAHEIVGIVAGGMLRAFAPLAWLEGVKIKSLRGDTGKRIVDPGRVDEWIRTRFGYVPRGAATAALLQQKSIGAFGRLVQ